MPLFTGVSAFPPTPIDAEGVVDTEVLQRRIDRLAAAGVDSICVLGSTGGYAYLDREQRRRAVAAAVEAVAGRVSLMAGVGAITTAETIAVVRDAERAGADAGLLAPVSYSPLTQGEVFGHVEAVGRASGLPLCLYNNPVSTRFTFDPDLIGRLAALPTVKTIKMPAPADGDFGAELSRLRQGDFSVGYSGDVTAVEAISAGAAAWYSVSAGLFPRLSLSLAHAASEGRIDDARETASAFAPLWTLKKAHGGLRVMSDAAGRMGLGDFAPPRPLMSLRGADQNALAEAVARLTELEADA